MLKINEKEVLPANNPYNMQQTIKSNLLIEHIYELDLILESAILEITEPTNASEYLLCQASPYLNFPSTCQFYEGNHFKRQRHNTSK